VCAEFDLGGDYTTNDEVTNLAEAGCFDRFEGYVGIAPRKSALSVFYVYPLNELTFRKDPGVSCIAAADADLTGSVRGSKR
jgi:hypothetical protein